MPVTPIIPTYITVHLGAPDEPAENIQVPFIEYIKNVASSEIYPTWPEAALRANILAQISFALNRIYTEYYRSRGYDFDITNSTASDQKFIKDRDIFDNISKIVDDIFNNYVFKQGNVEPYFTQYCDGRNVTCDGLSQWGTVSLAEAGLTPYQILQRYYGDDIGINYNTPTAQNIPSYPGRPLRLGSSGDDVRIIKRQLNRISENYPSIPKINNLNPFFDIETDAAVRRFQEIFNLTVDGIVGKSTWYKIKYIYNGVKGLSELYSEGLTLEDVSREFPEVLKQGDTGAPVQLIQYLISTIGYFNDQVSVVPITGVYDEATTNAVREFQTSYGLNPDGIVGRDTWNKLLSVYDETIKFLPQEYSYLSDQIYPGRFLSPGITGDDVTSLQNFLKVISESDPSIGTIDVTGTYDNATEQAIRIIQSRNDIPVNGITGPVTWNAVVNLYKQITQQ